ncbi:MAG: T9SS type A sorting domain-containing protein [Bacteroidia bacterium]
MHIMDMTGRLIRTQAFAASNSALIQRGDLPAGLYLVQVVTEQKALAPERLLFRD